MIPKKIHYCWFGGNPLPNEAKKCIESWKKYCPDYQIIEWNENNYDLSKNDYVKYTYENKKYAFLTDYVRLDIIYNEGGIYLDTDVELLKPLDDLLESSCFMGMEQPGMIATGLGFGAQKKNDFIKENKEYYEKEPFLDKSGNWIKTTCVKITTNLLVKKGLRKENKLQNITGIKILPVDYLCPLKLGTNKLTITENTYSIHHYTASWKSKYTIIRKISYRLIPVKQFIRKLIRRSNEEG